MSSWALKLNLALLVAIVFSADTFFESARAGIGKQKNAVRIF
jgi:hypothetical protein